MLPPARPIRPLPDHLINQIAAGEVVERPASIVKELVENSLDAGAGAIRIVVGGGGIEYLSVEDDGHGIARDQIVLALRRHCTSKIAESADLARIVSLGFRGEALASIGAVAEVAVTSRTRDAPCAYSVRVNPGQPPGEPIPASRPHGTTISVRDLFATVPARRQFLRRAGTELLAIQQLVRGVAFCAPAVSITLTHDAHRHWHAPAARDERTNAQRWRAVFGTPFARAARYLDVTTDVMRVHGWIGPADLARGQADLQFLAVNGRLIRDRQLLHGIRLAFGETLPAGRYACFALHLELDPLLVDVNVHPSKTEVRFKQIRAVHDVLYASARQALVAGASAAADSATAMPVPAVTTYDFPAAQAPSVREAAAAGAANRTPAAALSGARQALSVDDGSTLIGARFLPLVTTPQLLTIVDLCGVVRAALLAGGARESRLLTFPVRLPPAGPEGRTLETFAPWGFEFSAVGPALWVLRAIPGTLPALEAERLVTALLTDSAFRTAPLDAAVRACVRAMLVPDRWPDRDAWLAQWCVTFDDGPAIRARHSRTLDAARLAALFAAPR